ncbi:MotA/TolQ/ExbB proton channel family protein [Chitinophaga skermanii]|uniref:MotA/TolQ/ExbB proton channel family protein n=1 Tax=Chitinophaga skermanii TaxID=331697 RepID=A0A327Q0E1_9BACT|nr:MotA/TolQ/ExbB proton channel family protein [Chitinophaga skermanii]RAI97848.1 MotA/TolQ/ExbB proton channel family protein [Chitinophaga skermanii]
MFEAIFIGIFACVVLACVFYVQRFKNEQHKPQESYNFWNNQYIFDAIPSIFPTLGILFTAIGVTIGLHGFDTSNIQESIPLLLEGLKSAFVATILGIALLIVFQKYTGIIQKKIDSAPNKPKKQSDEVSALADIAHVISQMQRENSQHLTTLVNCIQVDVVGKLDGILQQSVNQQAGIHQMMEQQIGQLKDIGANIDYIRNAQFDIGVKANANSDLIVTTMKANRDELNKRFIEFADILKKNNTEALVDVMRNVTEQFNTQMNELIDTLVKENFQELNESVNRLNGWQIENKAQIAQLTNHFKQTTAAFENSSNTMQTVSQSLTILTQEEGKLHLLIKQLDQVMINDTKFVDITQKLSASTIAINSAAEKYDETTNKLNDWIKHERGFKDAATILIQKMEEFRNMNSDVWTNYRKEMNEAVNIIRQTSNSLNENVKNINAEFYERLSTTMENLDNCIQRFMIGNRN